MSDSPGLDLPAYYAAHMAPGAIDLSISSPPAVPLRTYGPGKFDHSFVTPSASEPLRTAIAARYTTLTADDIVVCAGASEALAAVAFATLEAGSLVLAETSTYPSLLNAARHCGAQIVPSKGSAAARLAVLTNPGVPFGDARDTAAFITQALAVGAVPLVDEVYRDLTLDGVRLEAAADLHPSAVSIGDLSKPLGLGGLRIGWVATRNHALLKKVDRELQLLSGGPSSLSVTAALCALATFDESVRTTMHTARSNSSAVYASLQRHRWTVRKPQAGLTAVATPPAPVSVAALTRLEAEGYFLLPTSVFGLPGSYRVSLLADPARLDDALGMLARGDRSVRTKTVVVLTKAPGVGRAKTRLAATLGDRATEQLALAFITDTLAMVASGTWDSVVALDPLDAMAELRALAPGANFVPQAPGDLGSRIVRALGAATQSGPALLIGSDTPDLPDSVLSDAFEALETHDAVLGPATDGGFYLLGLRAPIEDIFDGVEWSTDTVFERTAGNIAAAGQSCAVLQEWQDVDDAESLSCLATRLARVGSAPATRAILESLAVEAPHDS
ncbi:MAG: TIGR04282 family arsenosugar biosynthesis glycosyltransferase [Anaerolineaceae bacterium]